MQQPQPTTLKEHPHGTESFPCAIYRTSSPKKGTLVKHHWHEEVEILYFSGGEFRLEINMESFPVHSECLYFINPGELHSIIKERSGSYKEDAVVFSPRIICFDLYDTAQIQLIRPILNGKMLFPRCIFPKHAAFSPIRDAFLDMMHSFDRTYAEGCFKESPPSSKNVAEHLAGQLYIKSSLLRILAVLSDFQMFTPTEKGSDKRIESIKTALTYIRENYKEKIYISDLAGQVNLNEQYFCRFFKKAIGRSPMEYINEYRIKQSLRLLEETEYSVTEVCLECGYHNLGNFLREFRKHTGATPLQYLRRLLEAGALDSKKS